MKDKLNNLMQHGQTLSTRQIAKLLNISVQDAYKLCNMCDFLDRYGYKTKDGWEAPGHSTLKTNSLYWQKYDEHK